MALNKCKYALLAREGQENLGVLGYLSILMILSARILSNGSSLRVEWGSTFSSQE